MKPKTDYSAEDAETAKLAKENKAKRLITERMIKELTEAANKRTQEAFVVKPK